MMRLASLGLLLLALLVAPGRMARADSIDAYKQRIQQALDRVRQAETAPDVAEQKRLFAEAADLLETTAPVDLPKTDKLIPDNSDLIALLRDAEEYDPSALDQLVALSTLLERHPSTNHDTARAKLSTVLADLNTRPEQQNAIEKWLSSLIERFLQGLGRSASTLPGQFWNFVFLGIGACVLIAITLYFVRNLRRSSVTDSALGAAHVDDTPLSSSEAIDRAQKLAGEGDYRTAVRQLYLGTLLILDERGKLRFDKSLTNHETLRALRTGGANALAESLRPIVDYYDRVWYGFAAVQTPDYERYRAQVEAVKSA